LTIILTDSGVVRENIQHFDGYVFRYGEIKYFMTNDKAHEYCKLEGLENYTLIEETDNKAFIREFRTSCPENIEPEMFGSKYRTWMKRPANRT